MVLDYVSTDALEEVPKLKNYRNLTLWVLAVQVVVSGLYQYGRIAGAGIYYGMTSDDYKDTKGNCTELNYNDTHRTWKRYHCDDYFQNHYLNLNFSGELRAYHVADKCIDIRKQYYDFYDCNCKNDTTTKHKRRGKKNKNKCTENSNTATLTCYDTDTNSSRACSCKDDIFDAYEWNQYNCDKEYSNENWGQTSFAGIGFPWVGGIWFVLAVWTTALPQKPETCNRFTAASLSINIAADSINSFYYDGYTTYTLTGFSFIIVFPCLRFIRFAFNRLENDTKEKQLINLRTIALKKIRTIILLGLAQVYISLPAYQHNFEASFRKEEDGTYYDDGEDMLNFEFYIELIRHLTPTAAGGIFNVAYVVSIVFIDITRLHFVDFITGNVYNVEGLIGILQFIGFALTLALNRLELPTKEELVLQEINSTEAPVHQHIIVKKFPVGASDRFDMIQNFYWSTMVCIGLIWIIMIRLAYRVKNNGIHMKYFNQRWNKREAATTSLIRKEILKNKKHLIINMDEIRSIKQYIQQELVILMYEINTMFSYEDYRFLCDNLVANIENEIGTTIKEKILSEQILSEFGDPKHFSDIMTQWNMIRIDAIEEPLETLKRNIEDHMYYVKQTCIEMDEQIPFYIPDGWRKFLNKRWTTIKQKLTKIQNITMKKLDAFEMNLETSLMNLRAILLKNYLIGKDDIIELRHFMKNELHSLSKHINDKLLDKHNLFQNLIQNMNDAITTKLNHDILSGRSLYKFIDLASDINIEEQFQALLNDTIVNPWTTLKEDIINLLEKEKKIYQNESHQEEEEEEEEEESDQCELRKRKVVRFQIESQEQEQQQKQQGSDQYESQQYNVLASVVADLMEIFEQIDLAVQSKTIECKNNVNRSFFNIRRNIIIPGNVNTNLNIQHPDNSNNNFTTSTNDNIIINRKLEEQMIQLQQDKNEKLPQNNIEHNESISALKDDNSMVYLQIPNKTLEQKLRYGTELNKHKIKNIKLQRDNEGQGGNTNQTKQDELINQVLQFNIQLQKDNMELQEDNKKLHQYNKELKEKLDVELKNVYNVLETHNINL